MAEIVLRQGARVAIDEVRYRWAGDAEGAADFAADDFGDFVITFAEQCRIGGAAGKAGEAGHVFGGAFGEEGGIPNRAQDAHTFAAGNQKSESVARMTDLIAAIACGYNGDGRVLSACKWCGEFVRHILQNF